MVNKIWDLIKRHHWTGIIIIVLVVFVVFIIKILINNHNRDQAASVTALSRTDIVQQFAPAQTASTKPNSPVTDTKPAQTTTPKISFHDIRGTAPMVPLQPNVLSAETQLKSYRNEALGFSTLVPQDSIVTTTDNKVTATAGNKNGTYWTITVYANSNETLDSIENQMRGSPSVSGLSRTMLDGKPALKFTSPQFAGAVGLALVNNGRLYYLIGNPDFLNNFKFF